LPDWAILPPIVPAGRECHGLADFRRQPKRLADPLRGCLDSTAVVAERDGNPRFRCFAFLDTVLDGDLARTTVEPVRRFLVVSERDPQSARQRSIAAVSDQGLFGIVRVDPYAAPHALAGRRRLGNVQRARFIRRRCASVEHPVPQSAGFDRKHDDGVCQPRNGRVFLVLVGWNQFRQASPLDLVLFDQHDSRAVIRLTPWRFVSALRAGLLLVEPIGDLSQLLKDTIGPVTQPLRRPDRKGVKHFLQVVV